MRNARVAIAIAPRGNDAFWDEIARTAWIDATREYVVTPGPRQPASPAATLITADPAIAPGRYRKTRNTVSAPPAVVQSFAAAWIADDLKGTPPPNGRR
jgi:hypothetical protein